MLNLLPYEVIGEISKYIKVNSDLLCLKLVNNEFCKIIKSFSIIKLKVNEEFNKVKRKNLCVNSNCYNETLDIYVDNYREYEGRYIHEHQGAMNYDTIYINKNSIKLFSPYCCECFKKYIFS